MTAIEKIYLLLDKIEAKLEQQTLQESQLRVYNLKRLASLYQELNLKLKHPDFTTIFDYKAMNLAGIGLKDNDFGEIRRGKYVQIISIAYETTQEGKSIAKNSSLGYFGKAEKLTKEQKSNIIEFVLRWRYEKSFRHSEHYQELLAKLHE